MTHCSSRCGLTLVAALLVVLPAPLAGEHLPESDDECHFDGSDSQGCAVSALQLRVQSIAKATSDEEAGCHIALPGEACYNEIMWAKTDGMVNHPEWYTGTGLTPDSSDADIQNFIYSGNPSKCPLPCGFAEATPAAQWCDRHAVAPKLWAPADKGTTEINVLCYNLFWWSLYGLRHGNGNSAGKLIKESHMAKPFDVMGFQECEDPAKALDPVGLSEDFESFLGEHAICMAYNKKVWTLLDHGEVDVSEDMRTRYYGRRGTQWMRLEHKNTSTTLFFMNHHGPLSVNSGGRCGGKATAYNLLEVMATKGKEGDVLVLVGDFNANAASLTIQTLWSNLVQAFAGNAFGGVDNIFTNVDEKRVSQTNILGSGGSDHEAISAILEVGPLEEKVVARALQANTHEPSVAVAHLTSNAKPGYEWQSFWCGTIEDHTEYVSAPASWSSILTGDPAADPEHCCRECQRIGEPCQSFVWVAYSETAGGKECRLSGEANPGKKANSGTVSGLAYTTSAVHASESAKEAKRHM